MKWSRSKCFKWFIFYYFVSFVTIFLLFEHNAVFKAVSDKYLEIQRSKDDKICNGISSVITEGESIIVTFNPGTKLNNKTISKHFSLTTKWSGKSIFFPPGSAKTIVIDKEKINLTFHMPVISNYTAKLKCSHIPVVQYVSDSSLSPIKTYPKLHLEATEFSANSNFSRFICHGNDYLTRWCEGHNIAYFDGCIFFLSPAIFTFPEPFLVPGPRAPPFDKEVDRLVNEPIVIQFEKFKIPKKLDYINSSTKVYIYGTFHNYYMLWHQMFDFIIPFYKFVNEIKRGDTRENRKIFVKSDGVWQFFDLINLISKSPITILSDYTPMMIEDVIIGCIKYEKDISETRSYDDSISFNYNFDENSVPGLRDEMLQVLDIPTNSVGMDGKPLVVIIDRGMTSRNIRNPKEVEDYIREACPFCKVMPMKLEEYKVREQVEIISKASVLVGLHGSGLTHCLWMSPSRANHTTHLVEFLPYKYSCRNWYNTAANVARVKYYSVMNKEPDMENAKSLSYCWDNKDQCATFVCHDALRDQPFKLEISTLNETFSKIVEELKTTIPV